MWFFTSRRRRPFRSRRWPSVGTSLSNRVRCSAGNRKVRENRLGSGVSYAEDRIAFSSVGKSVGILPWIPVARGTWHPNTRALSEYQPVQVAGANTLENGPVRHSRGKKLSEYRPVQIGAPESVGISTCANLSVAQVAFPTGFYLSALATARSPRRSRSRLASSLCAAHLRHK